MFFTGFHNRIKLLVSRDQLMRMERKMLLVVGFDLGYSLSYRWPFPLPPPLPLSLPPPPPCPPFPPPSAAKFLSFFLFQQKKELTHGRALSCNKCVLFLCCQVPTALRSRLQGHDAGPHLGKVTQNFTRKACPGFSTTVCGSFCGCTVYTVQHPISSCKKYSVLGL